MTGALVAPRSEADLHMEKALHGIALMIIQRAMSTDRQRFSEIQRLAAVAQQLQRAISTSVDDFKENDIDVVGGAYHIRNPRQVGIYAGGGGDDVNELGREMTMALGVLGDMLGHNGDRVEAQNARTEVDELTTLLELPEEVRAELQPRIEQLKSRIRERAKKGQADAVVSTDVPRGHPTGEVGQESHKAGSGVAHAQREGSSGDATQDRTRAPVEGDAVVFSRAVPPDQAASG